MDSQENFSKINLNNKNLDLENSKSRFFNVSESILCRFRLHKPRNPTLYKKIQDYFQVLNYYFLYYFYFFSVLIFNVFIKNIITDDCC